MKFSELFDKLRKGMLKYPKRLLAIDPGGTTGYAYFEGTKLKWTKQEKSYPASIIEQYKPDLVVCEDYKIYASKVDMHTYSDLSVPRLIGEIEYVCRINEIKLHKQMAATAKGFCTNNKLKEWGFYEPNKPHARDAIRHGCYYLLFNKEVELC